MINSSGVKIWVNGTFDVLHVGHVEMLKYAKTLCPLVVVGIDSDRRVREMKGGERPINNQEDRKKMLESIRYVDSVFVFDTDEELKHLIATSKATVMVIGGDYRNKPIIGSEYFSDIVYFDRLEEYSSTKIIEKIRNL